VGRGGKIQEGGRVRKKKREGGRQRERDHASNSASIDKT